MSLSLFLGRIPFRHPSLPIHPTPPLASTSTSPTTQTSSPNPDFAVADYLVQTCGLSSDQAIRASKYIDHLKSPHKLDAVVQFLRQIGVSESDIRSAVLRDSRVLRSSVEKNWRPNIAKLQEVGFSIEDISGMISGCPGMFVFNLVPKIDFWLGFLGSAEYLSLIIRRDSAILGSSLEKVIVPNITFLQKECGLSVRQIVQLIKSCPRLIKSKTEVLEVMAERAQELGVDRSSGMFVYAIIIVTWLNQRMLNARINNLKKLGLSEDEVSTLVTKLPLILKTPEELMARKIEFILEEVGCDKEYLVRNPALLTYSLKTRLIPRNTVRKLLLAKGLQVANRKIASFVTPTEKQFVEKFVLPYEHAIPGLHKAYADACARKTGGID